MKSVMSPPQFNPPKKQKVFFPLRYEKTTCVKVNQYTPVSIISREEQCSNATVSLFFCRMCNRTFNQVNDGFILRHSKDCNDGKNLLCLSCLPGAELAGGQLLGLSCLPGGQLLGLSCLAGAELAGGQLAGGEQVQESIDPVQELKEQVPELSPEIKELRNQLLARDNIVIDSKDEQSKQETNSGNVDGANTDPEYAIDSTATSDKIAEELSNEKVATVQIDQPSSCDDGHGLEFISRGESSIVRVIDQSKQETGFVLEGHQAQDTSPVFAVVSESPAPASQ